MLTYIDILLYYNLSNEYVFSGAEPIFKTKKNLPLRISVKQNKASSESFRFHVNLNLFSQNSDDSLGILKLQRRDLKTNSGPIRYRKIPQLFRRKSYLKICLLFGFTTRSGIIHFNFSFHSGIKTVKLSCFPISVMPR